VFSIRNECFRGSQSHAGGTSHGWAERVLEDSATDEVFKGEALVGRAAIIGGVQLSAVKTVFRALKNVFEPMLLRPAAVPTRIPFVPPRAMFRCPLRPKEAKHITVALDLRAFCYYEITTPRPQWMRILSSDSRHPKW
jgi:hypothetical protein